MQFLSLMYGFIGYIKTIFIFYLFLNIYSNCDYVKLMLNGKEIQ